MFLKALLILLSWILVGVLSFVIACVLDIRSKEYNETYLDDMDELFLVYLFFGYISPLIAILASIDWNKLKIKSTKLIYDIANYKRNRAFVVAEDKVDEFLNEKPNDMQKICETAERFENHLERLSKIDISKVDCCDVCFEEYRFEPSKMMNPFIHMTVNHKTIKFCKYHAKMLKEELLLYRELND